tara:strand:+ start:5652 stop:5819 length:168 start_codon:yes stop_codon:yes gene_type:complete
MIGGINMTRCKYLDGWFDEQSNRLSCVEKYTGIEFVTGNKYSLKQKLLWLIRGGY